MTIAPSMPTPTPMLPSLHTYMCRLPTSRTYDRWSRSFWNPHRPTISGDETSCFSRFIAMPSTTTSSSTSPICLSIGLDWASLSKTFYEKVRIRVACRDPRKVPSERLYEIDKKLYLISFSVKGVEQIGDGESNTDGVIMMTGGKMMMGEKKDSMI
jgi:hypothetical protein